MLFTATRDDKMAAIYVTLHSWLSAGEIYELMTTG